VVLINILNKTPLSKNFKMASWADIARKHRPVQEKKEQPKAIKIDEELVKFTQYFDHTNMTINYLLRKNENYCRKIINENMELILKCMGFSKKMIGKFNTNTWKYILFHAIKVNENFISTKKDYMRYETFEKRIFGLQLPGLTNFGYQRVFKTKFLSQQNYGTLNSSYFDYIIYNINYGVFIYYKYRSNDKIVFDIYEFHPNIIDYKKKIYLKKEYSRIYIHVIGNLLTYSTFYGHELNHSTVLLNKIISKNTYETKTENVNKLFHYFIM